MSTSPRTPLDRFFLLCPLLGLGLSAAPGLLQAQTVDADTWRQCAATTDNQARLACFDTWAQQQQPLTPPPASGWNAPAASALANADAEARNLPLPEPVVTADAGQGLALPATPTNGGCRDPRYSEVSRYFELEPGSDCGTFSFRGYRPMSVSVVTSSRINQQPYSPTRGAPAEEDYQKNEMRLHLSARTKIAQGMLTGPTSSGKDSLWFGYTQQSYWQLFNPGLSRPFRNTDHEPEVFYVYPTDAPLPFGWRWRYSGVGLVHQSNGQSDPLSRSWNRWYVMTGAELDNRWQFHLKAWHRISERGDKDDNPGIQDYIGRGEVRLGWNVNERHHLALTARASLGKGRGSGRIEWFRTLGEGWNGGKSNLRLHVQLFSGYGDSLVDYNFKRTMFSVGLSLLDF
ncbi:phospholipase A [Comamonas composti]|uniref:phospholipase A n=1 Tax=Comamonas composti TaxID=408558 RepID=UPI000429EB47|nr:phospholipase A [Comamonas composti]